MEPTLRFRMRGADKKQSSMLVLMSPETRVPQDHPLRAIKKLADEALGKLSPVFDAMYASGGRPSIPPERLLKSMLLMALYSVRSERQFCEQLDYNLLFRWFLGMDMVEESFVPTVFSHNRDRLIVHDVAGEFLRAIVERARKAKLMSADHFTVEGTLIESWASLKSFKKKGDDGKTPPDDPGNPTVDFHGEKRCNETHESTTDPDARLARKGRGKEAVGRLVHDKGLESEGAAERRSAETAARVGHAKEQVEGLIDTATGTVDGVIDKARDLRDRK